MWGRSVPAVNILMWGEAALEHCVWCSFLMWGRGLCLGCNDHGKVCVCVLGGTGVLKVVKIMIRRAVVRRL